MSKSEKTKQKLVNTARNLFWNRGFSNVSVRDITKAAGVDAALVSRYFGSKQGLFETTLEGALEIPEHLTDSESFLEMMINKQVRGLHESDEPSLIKMMIMNAADPDIGDQVCRGAATAFSEPMAEIIGPPRAQERLAMVMAVIVGASIMRHDMKAAGMADCSEDEYRAQLRHLVDAAMAFGEG